MKIAQILYTLQRGDAIGNEVLAIDDALRAAGYDAHIYALNILCEEREGLSWYREMPDFSSEDLVIFHFSTGDSMTLAFLDFPCKKVLRYHNITPSSFFYEYDPQFALRAEYGLSILSLLAARSLPCIAVSAYNKAHLVSLGYAEEQISVLPILLAMEDYARVQPDAAVRKTYADGRTNVLFAGRIAPNKCYEDVIAAFALYQRFYDADARLLLVGSPIVPSYLAALRRYIGRIGVENVHFTLHVPFAEILAYYSVADLFLCQSAHEGFCVPLIEAMVFEVPIVAYASSAVPDTLGDAGVLLSQKDPLVTAGVLHRLQTDAELRAEVLRRQKERLDFFDPVCVREAFLAYIAQMARK